jgi:hypothetical protein
VTCILIILPATRYENEKNHEAKYYFIDREDGKTAEFSHESKVYYIFISRTIIIIFCEKRASEQMI